MADHAHPSSKALLDEEVHVNVREQVELGLGELEEGIPREARKGVVVGRV